MRRHFPAPQGVHCRGRLEMEVDSPPATRREARHKNDHPGSPQGLTNTAIQTVENVLRDYNLLEIVGSAWRRVKDAALEGTGAQGRHDALRSPAQSQDIKDIKVELKELSKAVVGLAKQPGPKGTTSYVSVVKNRGTLKGPT
jgi:hypothetical protein